MAILSVNTPYVDGGTVTSTNLNALVTNAAFVSGSTDGVTTELSSGAIIVKDGGLGLNKLNTSVQAKLLQGLEIEANGESIIGGTKAGDQRGTFALDIQNKELTTSANRVASGDSAVAFGFSNMASGNNSSAVGSTNQATALYSSTFGYNNSASGQSSVAIGDNNGASGESSVAIGDNNSASSNRTIALGYGNSATSSNSSAIGSSCSVSGTESHAFGSDVAISSPYSVEVGVWSTSSVRDSAVKITKDGGVALTCENSATAPSDNSTPGNEDIGELGRSMFTIQRDGDDFTLYFNDAGTIKSVSLGTVT